MEDLVRWADIIGIIAGILVVSSSFPQIMKSYKTKKMSDISIYLMSLIASVLFFGLSMVLSVLTVIIATNAAGLPVCKQCNRQMLPLEWYLGEGICVICKTANEMKNENKS
jgi:uncharacterized protein with PQ loop repeat